MHQACLFCMIFVGFSMRVDGVHFCLGAGVMSMLGRQKIVGSRLMFLKFLILH